MTKFLVLALLVPVVGCSKNNEGSLRQDRAKQDGSFYSTPRDSSLAVASESATSVSLHSSLLEPSCLSPHYAIKVSRIFLKKELSGYTSKKTTLNMVLLTQDEVLNEGPLIIEDKQLNQWVHIPYGKEFPLALVKTQINLRKENIFFILEKYNTVLSNEKLLETNIMLQHQEAEYIPLAEDHPMAKNYDYQLSLLLQNEVVDISLIVFEGCL
ncbi:MAG: hypothetical protein KDD50_01095 [Bdellovibrionales bacterium]|nr:hypothetical protein [Bdellovibrionales bacterium]